MVSEGEGRKDAATHRLSGRAPDNRLVHFAADFSAVADDSVRPGDMVTVEVTYAAPHHLVADGPIRSVRRTRAGDAWERRTSLSRRADRRRARDADRRRPRPAAPGARLRLSVAVVRSPGTRGTDRSWSPEPAAGTEPPRSRCPQVAGRGRAPERAGDGGAMDQLGRRLADQTASSRGAQAAALGLAPHDLRRLVRRRDLTPLHPGVFVDHTGKPRLDPARLGRRLPAL